MSKSTNVAKHAAIYSAATVLSKAVGFIMIPVYTHYLRAEGYGVLGMIDICLALLSAMVAAGMANAITRFYYEHDSQKERNLVVSTGLYVMLAVVPVLALLTLPFAGVVSRLLLGMDGYGYYFVLAFITFGLSVTGSSAQSYVIINQRSMFFSVVSLARLIVGLSLNIYLIAVLQWGVLGYLYSSLICALLFGVLWHVYVFWKVGLGFSREYAREMLAFVIPLIPSQFAMLIKERSGTIILRSYAGIATVGVFELAFKFIAILPLFITIPFFRTWTPRQFELALDDDGADVMAKTFGNFVTVMLFIALVMAVTLPEIIVVISPPEFWRGASIVTILLLSRTLVAASQFFRFGIFHAKKTVYASYINIALAAASIVVGVPMIAWYGLMGAALAGLIVETMRLFASYIVGQKLYRIPYEWAGICKTIAIAVVCYALISRLSVQSLGLEAWCAETVSPFFASVATLLRLDTVKDGKLLEYLTRSTPIVVNGVVKTTATLLYPVGLVAAGLLKPENLRPSFLRFNSDPKRAQ